MLRKIDWDNQIGRRLRLRDLHVFFTVAQRGSMAKAAAQLGVSTPTVSEVIADLERGIGVQLLNRSPRGVEPTIYGDALLKRTLIVFDELKQSIKDIEYLSDPTTCEIKVACPLGVAFTVMPHVIERFVKKIRGWSCTWTKWLLRLLRMIFGNCGIENMTSSWNGEGRCRRESRRMT